MGDVEEVIVEYRLAIPEEERKTCGQAALRKYNSILASAREVKIGSDAE